MRPTRFEPATFGLKDRDGDTAKLGGTRVQADFGGSDSAEIGWTPSVTVPHFVPHTRGRRPSLLDRRMRRSPITDVT